MHARHIELFAALVALLWGALLAPSAHAQVQLRLEEAASGDIRVDGMLSEWRRIRFAEVGDGDDASFRYALAYDADGLYVAATVRDDRMVRTRNPGALEDALIVTLAFPDGDALVAQDVYLFAGVSGRSAAVAKVAQIGAQAAPAPLRGARVVEAPLSGGGGYDIEAYLPWRSIPGGRSWQQGRGAVRLRDVDLEANPEVESELTTAPVVAGDLERLPPLAPTGGDFATLMAFQEQQNLVGTMPRFDLRGDVQGDAQEERVVVLDRFVAVMGAGYRGGNGFDFMAIPVRGGADVRAAELRDLTGDGKSELVLVARQGNAMGNRDVWSVIGFDGASVRPLFQVETRKETGAGSVEVTLRVARARSGPPTIEIAVGRASGLTSENFRESPATDAAPILLPWGPHRARSYRWDGQTFAMVSEQANPSYQPPAEERPATADRVPAQPVVTAAPGVDELLAAVRRNQGIPRQVTERFRVNANLSGDARPETMVVYGKAIVIVGPGYRGGDGFFYFDMPAATPEDVLDVTARDVNGDGWPDVVMRIRQVIGEVTREVLLAHCMSDSFPRLLAVEIRREMGGSSIQNEVRFVGPGRRTRLEILPGTARGWDARTYPFADEGANGIEPPLLPWAGHRYVFQGALLRR